MVVGVEILFGVLLVDGFLNGDEVDVCVWF